GDDVLIDLGECARRQIEHVRLGGNGPKRTRELVARRRADLTEVLCQDDLRFEGPQQKLIDQVQALSGGQSARHGGVYLTLRQTLEPETRPADDRKARDIRWVIALMRPADQILTGAERADDLRRGR